MQDEHERQRRLREKLEAGKREERKAEEERQELQRIRDEAERLRLQKEAIEAESLRRQQEEAEKEKERGKRLQKQESAKRLQERDEAERRARVEEANRARASPSTSPPRHGGFNPFRRRRDGPSSPGALPSPQALQTGHSNREMDTIRPGGGGAVLGIDAPLSAVNAGGRVS
jgi:multidrug efflux pump subunit AcrA (membrane-fusion protein)